MNTFTNDQEYPGEDISYPESVSTAEGCDLGRSTIDTLSDDVLLCIFDSYRQEWGSTQSLGM